MQRAMFLLYAVGKVFIICVGQSFLVYAGGAYFDNNIFDHSSAALNRTDVRVVPN